MLKPLNVFSLGTVMNLKHTNCLILLLTKYLQVEMYFSMSRKQEIMTKTVMRNGRDFLMKELKKSSNISPQAAAIPAATTTVHPRNDNKQQQEGLSDMDNSSSHSSPRGEDRSSQSGEEDNQLRRSSRQIRLPERYKDYALMSSISNAYRTHEF
jgi:hypothetical protein